MSTNTHGAEVGESDKRLNKTAFRGASKFVTFTKRHSDDQIKENETGGACGTYGNTNAHMILVGKAKGNNPIRKTQEA